MTWGEFKVAVESKGVLDVHEIFYIDCHCPEEYTVEVNLDGYPDYGITIT